MPPTLPCRLSKACLLLALVSSAAVADKLPENEIFVSIDENGIEIFSNIAPTPMHGAKNKQQARAKSTIIQPAAPGSKTRGEQANVGQQGTRPREISDSFAPEVAALPADSIIHELPASEEPQDH